MALMTDSLARAVDRARPPTNSSFTFASAHSPYRHTQHLSRVHTSAKRRHCCSATCLHVCRPCPL
jgi:hypothetical protein